MSSNRILKFVMLSFILSLPFYAHAEDSSRASWNNLDANEKKLLNRFKDRWSEIPEQRKLRLLKGAKRWQNMNPEQRKQAKQRLKRWKKMTPEQRKIITEFLAIPSWALNRKFEAIDKLECVLHEIIKKGK